MASSLTGISIASSYDSLLKVGDNDGLSASLQVISDGLGTETGISLNNAGDLTATGTITANSFVGDLSGNISGNSTVSGTLTFGSLSDGTITITDIKDEDNMSSDSNQALATQQSIKAYVDAQVTASDLDFQGDSGGVQSIDLDSETFTIAGTSNEITTTSAGNALTVSLNPNISGLTSVAATTFTGALTGNASTATALATARNIAGVSFDGTADISLTTDNITEGSNLYYTSARFDSALSAKSTTDLSEGTNLYYTDARADARIALNTGSNLDLSSKSTSDLSEGSNLYFTDERVDDRVGNLIVGGTGITATYDDAAGSLTVTNSAPDQTVAITASNGVQTGGTYPNLTVAGTDATTSAKGVASFSSSHFSVASGAVSIAADSIDDTLIDFGTGANQVNTDDLPEGSSNLYYTAERVDDQVNTLLTAGSGISLQYDDPNGTLTINSTVSGLGYSDFSVTDAGGDGSLSYNNTNGVFTYTGPSQSEVQAHITKSYVDGLGIAATSATTAAGLTGTPNISVGTISASGTITGNVTGDLTGDVTGDVTGNVTGNLTGNVTGNTSGSSGSTTGNAATATALQTARTINGTSFDGTANISFDSDAVSEGSSNQYFTNARVDSRLAATAQTIDGNGSASGTTIEDGGISVRTGTGSVAYLDLYCEVSNAHRVRVKSPAHSAYSGNVDLTLPTTTGTLARTADIPSDTDGLTEGSTNLYYTDARANAAFDTRLATKDTDNLTQGSTNLYNQTHTGDVTGATALTIASDAVTYDKMQDLVTANRVLGGTAAGTIAEVQIATDMISNGAVTSAKVDTDLRNVEYIGLDSTDYLQWVDDTQLDVFINNVNKFRFEADGDFHADGDVIAYSTTTPSDQRLKENVKVIDNALEKLDQISGVTFDWIDRDDKRSGGVIAQELEKIMPEIVKDIDNLKDEDKFKAVDYNGVIALLIEAVKELNDKCNNCKK
jgi:hypothetical protein